MGNEEIQEKVMVALVEIAKVGYDYIGEYLVTMGNATT